MNKKSTLLFWSKYILAMLILWLLVQSCSRIFKFRNTYKSANELIHTTDPMQLKQFLKVHHHNGDITIFKDIWEIDTINQHVGGFGATYDYNRILKSEGSIQVKLSEITLLETNKPPSNADRKWEIAMAPLVFFNPLIVFYCIVNPKACYGSCPTFYFDDDDNFHYADAEGFSNAVLPSLEYGDIDALGSRYIHDHILKIYMKNEALETHYVNNIKLLAYPISENERVYQSTQDEFFKCVSDLPVSSAFSESGDITHLLIHQDFQEYFSLSDPSHLSSKEEIILHFDSKEPLKNPGFQLHFRQTLMSTFLFYSALGYMGDEFSDFLAHIERTPKLQKLLFACSEELGGIEVFIKNDTNNHPWKYAGTFNESGPIAINKQILPLIMEEFKSSFQIKLIMNKGHWRLDFAGLTSIVESVIPIEIEAQQVSLDQKIMEEAKRKLSDNVQYVVSMPGDVYTLEFKMPEEKQKYDLFLYSKGFYLEWMRKEWLKDKNKQKLIQMAYFPKQYLKSVTNEYKLYEENMEEQFWNSKITKKRINDLEL